MDNSDTKKDHPETKELPESKKKLRELEQRRKWIEAVVKLIGSKKTHNDLGYVFLELGDLDEAKRQFELAIEAGFVEGNYGLCLIARNRGDLEEAEKYALLALSCKIEEIIKTIHNDIADEFFRCGKLDKAEIHFKIAADAGNSISNISLAYIYLQKKDYENAKKQIEIAISKGEEVVRYLLAGIFFMEGKENEAEEQMALADKNTKGDAGAARVREHVLSKIIAEYSAEINLIPEQKGDKEVN